MRVVALLRGVNLGPSRTLKMSGLRAAVESLGHTDVETYLQSGNVVFTPKGRPDGDAVRAAIKDTAGLDTNVLIRTGKEMQAIVGANPYPVDDPTKVVVTFLASAADAKAVRALDVESFAPEELTVHGTEVYLHLPGGQGRSKLAAATTRNWRTVEALAAMTAP
jgi:uncharacterized protein (DUF1697 family)